MDRIVAKVVMNEKLWKRKFEKGITIFKVRVDREKHTIFDSIGGIYDGIEIKFDEFMAENLMVLLNNRNKIIKVVVFEKEEEHDSKTSEENTLSKDHACSQESKGCIVDS